jgi:elongation factor 1-beta
VGSSHAPAAAEEDDDEIDLFGEDEDDAETERIKAERVAAYNEKKANKPKTIAKVCFIPFLSAHPSIPNVCTYFIYVNIMNLQSVVTLEVKPWDDETDMKALENAVRSVEMDGLVWGASKLVPIGYGIKKLQVTIVIGAWPRVAVIFADDNSSDRGR